MYDSHFQVKYRTAASILAHPEYSKARVAYLNGVLALYGDDVFLNRLLLEGARTVIFAVAICLDAGFREEDRDTWPTISNLKKALAPFGLASPRRIEQVVSRLIQTGYLESRVSPHDARVRLLAPTPKMLAHDQEWLISHYRPLAILFGEGRYARALGRDPAFQRVQRGVACDFFVQSAMVLLRNPDIMLFLARDAGILVLLRLVSATLVAGSATVSLSLADLARSCSISRTHVRQLLNDAQTQGLVQISQAARQITILPRALQSLDQFIADGMSNHDLTGAAAMRVLEAAA
ncbi:hypothetical protein LQ954_14315 [Sphingomonas sp. IC-11]|uniref:hypothetical protein n=1 Tax=Sphingomonas sp. IC-11 TaxID=2898528 RepID=UPI001E4C9FEF|nr:hypothetical protein [Sphingomonas sp. IC-11]MCD2317319.1 hypothetical protein [Sphingomonas sp. IC-11]